MGPDGLFVSQRTGSHSAGIHVPFTNCFVSRWFCVVHDPKPLLHSHDSVLANSKTQNTFLFTVNAIFLHDYPLAVEPGSTPRPLVPKKFGEILYLLICSLLPCLSWLLRSRVRKSRRDLWITLYIYIYIYIYICVCVCVCVWSGSWAKKIQSTFSQTIFKIHFNSTPPYKPRSSKWPLSVSFTL